MSAPIPAVPAATIPQIFDPHAAVAQAWRRRTDAFLTEQLALRAVERLQTLATTPRRVALLGPLHRTLANAFPGTNFLPALIHADGRLQADAGLEYCLDIGTLALVHDLPGALAQIRRALPTGGGFFSLLYGGASLHEVRQALLMAETELTGGATPRLHPTLSGEAALQLLQRAGFATPVTDRELMTVSYTGLSSLACDLRAAGLSNQLAQRARGIPPRHLFPMADAAWRAGAPAGQDRALATFEVIALTGWQTA